MSTNSDMDTAPVKPIKETFSAIFTLPSRVVRGRLVVKGKIRTANKGWCLRLVSSGPQGVNPRDLLLTLEAVGPRGLEPQHEAETEVSYVSFVERDSYDTVTIINRHGPGLTLNIAYLISEQLGPEA